MKNKVNTIIYIMEKNFFDVNDDSDTNSNTNTDADKKEDLDIDTDNKNDEPAEIQTTEALQLRTLWSYLLYTYRLTKQLSNINETFNPSYEEFKQLYTTFRDFVINYEEYDPQTRKTFITEFRTSFIQSLKALSSKLDTL